VRGSLEFIRYDEIIPANSRRKYVGGGTAGVYYTAETEHCPWVCLHTGES